MKPALVVLAAGIGSRYQGLKQMESVGPHGEAVLDYSVFDALRAGFGKVVFVIRREIEASFRETVGDKYQGRAEVRYVFQELDLLPPGFFPPGNRSKPWGTGHATFLAEPAVEEPFAVVNADDFYGADAYRLISDHLQRAGEGLTHDYAMVGYVLRETLSEHGHVARGLCEIDPQGRLLRVVERTRIFKQEGGASTVDESGQEHALSGDEIVSMNFWGFTPSVFPSLKEQFERFLRRNREDPKSEFYLPTVVDRLVAEGRAGVRVLSHRGRWLGITYREDKPRLVRGIQELVRQGVYPEKLWE
jgi:NDP-sugar pyrophosphorylase family protein